MYLPSLFFLTAHVFLFPVSFTSFPFCPFLFLLPLSFSLLLFLLRFLLHLYLCCGCCNPGGVSSGQSYPSAQYESGLQQRGQQGKQPGHQPHTLLHTPWWVAVVEGIKSKFKMRRRRKAFILFQWLMKINDNWKFEQFIILRVISKRSLACFSAFSLSHCSVILRLVCVFLCVCGQVLNCMCVSILVAATRSYSRSTGALHTPDTFGAAGEGWVHLFLCTSPTHFALIFVRSVCFQFFFSTTNACFFSCPSSSEFLIYFVVVFLTFCSRTSNLAVESHVSSHAVASWQPFSQFYKCPFFLYLALTLLCKEINTLSHVFCPSFFLPQWRLQCLLTSHYINLQGYSWEM